MLVALVLAWFYSFLTLEDIVHRTFHAQEIILPRMNASIAWPVRGSDRPALDQAAFSVSKLLARGDLAEDTFVVSDGRADQSEAARGQEELRILLIGHWAVGCWQVARGDLLPALGHPNQPEYHQWHHSLRK